MFRHEGPSRSTRKNALLAAYLAAVAGYVNSGGFLVVGSFTSHVTGSVGRLGNDLATYDLPAAALAVILVVAFFLGAFAASVIIELRFRTRPNAYAFALFVEGALLSAFVLAAGLEPSSAAHVLDLQAAILCCAMGMQNSMVTRLSGAVVRTTHLTGVITDLGIEAAHWYQWLRARSAHNGGSAPKRPAVARSVLLLTISLSFTAGAVAGASLTLALQVWAMIAPALAVFCASAYAFRSARLPHAHAERGPSGSTRPSQRPPALNIANDAAPSSEPQRREPQT